MEPLNIPARDPYLWQQAKARARFKSGLSVYLLVNIILWAVWALTGHEQNAPLPWPAWSTIFWGIAVVFQGFAAYGGWNKQALTEREYERLTQQQ